MIRPMRESELIEWIRRQGGLDPAKVPVGPGDDCAVVACGGERLLVTVDQVLDGVHFVLDRHGPEAAGRKAMARNLSDVAAMAGMPLAGVASVALPEAMSPDSARKVYRGLRMAGDPFDCPVVGGDVGVWDGPLAVSVTAFARPDGIEPIRRDAAAVGDAVCVTGRLGGAWSSDRHLTFTPRVSEARRLAARARIHAMIDLSDGLATDLTHVCRASGVGARIHADAMPIHPDVTDRADGGLSAALGDGEDYELLFTLAPQDADALIASQPLGVPVTRVGEITEATTIRLVSSSGTERPLRATGWEHGST